MTGLERGQVWDVDLPEAGTHPVVILTRTRALDVLRTVTVAQVTSTESSAPTEVAVQPSADLRLDHESFVRCDNIATLDQQMLRRLRGTVSPIELHDIGTALAIAFDL